MGWLDAHDRAARLYEYFYFADTEELANELALLVLNGEKQATASLVWSLTAAGKNAPSPGDLSVMTDWGGRPLGIIETKKVEILPFNDVPAHFAFKEGEGDKSLKYWRETHWDYFSRECKHIGMEPCTSMPVVCEEFELVYR